MKGQVTKFPAFLRGTEKSLLFHQVGSCPILTAKNDKQVAILPNSKLRYSTHNTSFPTIVVAFRKLGNNHIVSHLFPFIGIKLSAAFGFAVFFKSEKRE